MAVKIIFLVLISASLHAQYDHITVFPNVDGENLRSALIAAYKPETVLTLTEARDTLYKRIYLENDSVSCVYSGLTKYLDPSADPSQFLFQNGGNEDINLEHGYPRSKGADSGSASSNMYHLFPSRVTVNTARGSDPMTELNDSETHNWYYKNLTLSQKPDTNENLYSEDSPTGFEPREDFKGNIARAYFYFYTMYENEAFAADPEFFELQLEDLCRWHLKDPVDSLEWVRNFKIARYQSDRVNPFILDCSLSRLYCDERDVCEPARVEEVSLANIIVYPNLVHPGNPVKIESAMDLGSRISIRLYDVRGKKIDIEASKINETSVEFFAPQQEGFYILQIFNKGIWLGSKQIIVI